MSNSVTFKKEGNGTYAFFNHGEKAGVISLNEKSELYFETEVTYRQQHITAEAVYQFTRYAHSDLHEPIIHALIPVENEMAKHIVEHDGYQLISKDETTLYYEHRREETRSDDAFRLPEGCKVLYLAGGCFWGSERVFKELKGVRETTVGYANGHTKNPTYEDVCRMEAGFKETVRVVYDPSLTSTLTLLKAYFLCIDPEQENGQKGDIGTQYMTGVYYKTDEEQEVLESFFEEEKAKHPVFYTELKPLECFYEAEEYHQDYLLKNPSGYCHITKADLEAVRKLNEL